MKLVAKNGKEHLCYQDHDLQSPDFLQKIEAATQLWSEKCQDYVDRHGDIGTAVIGAGIAVWYLAPRHRNPEAKVVISRHAIGGWQAEEIWLASLGEVLDFLTTQGVEGFYKSDRLG